MSVARTSTCLFCTFKQAAKPIKASSRRQFHLSPVRSKPRTPRPDPVQRLSKDEIAEHYSKEQAKAIDATQQQLGKSIADMHERTMDDTRPWRPRYVQDMTEIDPVVDKPVKAPWSSIDDSARLKTDDELDDDIMQFAQTMPENDVEAEKAFLKFMAENRVTVGKPEAEFNVRSAVAPQIPKMTRDGDLIPTRQSEQKKQKDDKKPGQSSETKEEISPALIRLMQMTGFNQSQLRSLRVKSIISHRVVNQTRLGKIQKQYWLSVAGNQNGLLGIGEGKSEESAEGMIQSQYRAIRNMVPVMRYEGRTIFGDVTGKEGATELELYNRPPGFGLRCQQYIYEMCKCAGIQDIAARVTRARNPMNTVKAAFKALQSQKDPEEVAKGRGKKMVDVRKVYYAGNV